MNALEVGSSHVDDLAARVTLGVSEALAVLTSLEIRGLVTQLPGKNFRRSEASRLQ
jgi:predicted Rossmann fold nucleotide-binding protein DprA/Smf involved in DNA uptake